MWNVVVGIWQLLVEVSRILSNVRRKTIAIGVQNVGKFVKQPLNSANIIPHWEGPKKLCLYINIACTWKITKGKRFCCCRRVFSNSTKQLHPNPQRISIVMLLSTTQYIQHTGHFPKCKIARFVVQTCAQQLGDE